MDNTCCLGDSSEVNCDPIFSPLDMIMEVSVENIKLYEHLVQAKKVAYYLEKLTKDK